MPFSVSFSMVSKQQEVPATLAGRPLFVPPGVPGASGRSPDNFS